MNVHEVRSDLIAEQQSLDDIVAAMSPDQWALDTPSPGWTIRDQVGHLTYFDGAATLAVTDPDAFTAGVAELMASAAAGDDLTLAAVRRMTPEEALDAWRANRSALAAAADTLDDATRIVWYGPSMGSKSFLTARMMEAWAHGQDIADTLGVHRVATDRLRHIAQLGFITRGWSYMNRGLDVPAGDIRVELNAPSGELWRFGPDDAAESVVGAAEDFCLVVTQRRHVDDTGLEVTGDAARDWMLKAQIFAGPPTSGPSSSSAA
jgi:uncharacterized protein (TIGR03084 family)